MTKKDALYNFKQLWNDHCEAYPHWQGDKPAKREAWSDYIDMLQKGGLITEKQAHSWDNPF
jgi:hypothetical protein